MSAAEFVTSLDGTKIAFWREGTGRPLLLVHGGICDHLAWYHLVPLLAKQFMVYTFDRRGRGSSGDAAVHTVEREVEDIVALLKLIGEPAHLLGHSAGAILSLKAAAQNGNLRSLMLYEPPFIVDGAREQPAPEVLEKMKALLAAGEPDGALRIAMRESVAVPDSEIDEMQAGPGWEHLRRVARAIPYDWKLWDERLRHERLQALQVPVLLLLGSQSPGWIRKSTQAVFAALPLARVATLPGQAHFAMLTAPELMARAVVEFAAAIE
jgi:pimeloyl-ACP methyl ester carboxylesterase